MTIFKTITTRMARILADIAAVLGFWWFPIYFEGIPFRCGGGMDDVQTNEQTGAHDTAL